MAEKGCTGEASAQLPLRQDLVYMVTATIGSGVRIGNAIRSSIANQK